jgi:GWxTD domain-containing protein
MQLPVPKDIDKKQPIEAHYFLKLTPRLQKLYIENFWQMREVTAKEEFVRRIQIANYWFKDEGILGWRTWRGRLLLMMGQPDYIEFRDKTGRTYLEGQEQWESEKTQFFQIWRYWNPRGFFGDLVDFVFQMQPDGRWMLRDVFNDFLHLKTFERKQQEMAPTDDGWAIWKSHITQVYKPQE